MTSSENNRSKEEVSNAILQTATQLFTEHGIDSVSMHQIAKTTGVGQATLYRRYANKADLCLGMMQDYFDYFRCQVSNYLRDASSQSVQSRLKGVIAIILTFLDEKSKMLGIIHAQQLSEKNSSDFFQSPPYHFLRDTFRDLLQSAEEESLYHSIDPEFVAHSYIAVLSPHMYRHLVQEKGYTKDQIYERFCQMYIDPLFRTTELR